MTTPAVALSAPCDTPSEPGINPFALLLAPEQVLAAAASRGLVPLDRCDPFEREERLAHPGTRRRGRPLGSGKHQRAARAAAGAMACVEAAGGAAPDTAEAQS